MENKSMPIAQAKDDNVKVAVFKNKNGNSYAISKWYYDFKSQKMVFANLNLFDKEIRSLLNAYNEVKAELAKQTTA